MNSPTAIPPPLRPFAPLRLCVEILRLSAALLLPLALAACRPATTAPDPDTVYLTTTRFRGFEPALAGDGPVVAPFHAYFAFRN